MENGYLLKNRFLPAVVIGIVFVFISAGCGGDGDHFARETVTMKVGEYKTFAFTGGYTGDLNWATDDTNVATVPHEGNAGDETRATVHAVGRGKTALIAVDERFKRTGWHIVVE